MVYMFSLELVESEAAREAVGCERASPKHTPPYAPPRL